MGRHAADLPADRHVGLSDLSGIQNPPWESAFLASPRRTAAIGLSVGQGDDGGADPFRGLAQGMVEEVAVARRGLRLGVAEQGADDRQRQAGANQDRGVGVAQVVDADVWDVGFDPRPVPEPLDLGQGMVRGIAGKDEAAEAGLSGPDIPQQGDGCL